MAAEGEPEDTAESEARKEDQTATMACNISDQQVDKLVQDWLKWDRNQKTKNEVEELLEKKDFGRLRAIMGGRLAFGTAGMRAEMAAGFNRLNDLVIIQTTQGLLRYLQKTCPRLAERGIIIGFDARHNSERFAQLVANVFVRGGVKVYLFSKIVPTPFVSYGVVQYGCDIGVMVTASHNPGADNGYKVYWKNGAQILSPHDKGICEEAAKNLEPWDGSWDTSIIESNPLMVDPLSDLTRRYFEDALEFLHYKNLIEKSPLKLTYTPFHGVGYYYTPNLLKEFGFRDENIVYVEEQKLPDPDFPTVKFPNPEEGAPVLALSIKTANAARSSLILANDPDADRLQIAERQPNGVWRIFTGNEIGGLFAWWQWHSWRQRNPNGNAADVYMINSAVSSKIVQTISKKEGFNYVETLTGFKWMGNRTEELRSQGKTVLLAWEESIGYMPGNTLDKDGVLSAALFAEYAAYLDSKGSNLAGQLEFLYKTYGYHLGCISYFINYDRDVTERIFSRIRNFNGDGKYPSKVQDYAIKHVRDLTVGYDNSQKDDKPLLPVDPSCQMITFTLETGSTLTLRTSGTEPKIKYYIEVITDPKSDVRLEDAQKQLQCLIDYTVQEFLQPEKNNLKSK